ncbi:hypothetical protein BDZ97DRAFT_1951713 [Flammula alnicola]|nr:hypothetical protein BDZ97DRAFT_1951713 [Flammula alnicola]
MLVDNPLYQQSYFASGSSSTYSEYPTELSDIFDTELFNNTFAMGGSVHSSSPSGSRGSSPQNLLTPPQEALPTSFPEVHDEESNHNIFSFLDDDLKPVDPLSMPSTSSDFMNLSTYGGGVSSYGIDMGGYGMAMDMSSMNVNMGIVEDPMQTRGIDPQLVDTPSAVSDHGDDDSDTKESPLSPVVEKKEPEKPTVTIAPVKVGGTVQSGGVVKKIASSTNKEKENAIASFAESEAGDNEDDDELPQDWRPSPEEKRQLRNKISARNFRVRRKEYISTLEGDIAERDRMLDHFRTQLGSQESENLALRQEIAALKKALLDGRGGSVNLPPPAPLPEQSAAEVLAATASSSTQTSAPLLTANTQKDLPTSPRMGNRFWGGVGVGGGFTPVHTTLVPDISTVVRKGLQENMNPSLNAHVGLGAPTNGLGPAKPLPGFDGFADLNPFTMKTLDAYPTTTIWTCCRSSPHYFTPSAKNGSTLSALLSGKHASAYPSPPTSPLLTPKVVVSSSKEREMLQQREKEHQHAILAAMASQTVFRKLGSAFWEAFSGSSSSSSASTSHAAGHWDQDKVQRVLEGKAVLRVVDVEPATPPASPKPRTAVSSKLLSPPLEEKKSCAGAVCDILEDSMRSLSLGKK